MQERRQLGSCSDWRAAAALERAAAEAAAAPMPTDLLLLQGAHHREARPLLPRWGSLETLPGRPRW